MTFVDLTKAFDAVSREGLWKIMAKFGCPAKFKAKCDSLMVVFLQGSKMMASFLIRSL